MEKQKSEKKLITINGLHKDILKEMMEEDRQDSLSIFIGFLLIEEYKRRQAEKTKRPVGRPRKEDDEEDEEIVPDYTNDLPKDQIWYGKQVGRREMSDILKKDKQIRENIKTIE